MKYFVKCLSTLLALLMVLGTFASLLILDVSAADTKAEEPTEKSAATIDYYTEVFNTPEEALQWMTPYMENDNFIFYINEYTATFAVKNKHTEQVIFSNPYDVPSAVGKSAVSIKNQVLSQIHVKYIDNGLVKEMYSFSDAVLSEQIKIKKIKSGVRVEYIIGNEATRKLVPHLISEERFQQMIVNPIHEVLGDAHNFTRFTSFFIKEDLSECTSKKAEQALLNKHPIVATKPIRALTSDITPVEMNFCEELIKGYCPDYTFDEMERDHEECMYEAENELSPVFKMALEYSLNDDGFTVRLPNNGLRYNSTLYQIENLLILPYMGCGNSYNTGYTFLPDGSGALFTFEDLAIDNTYKTSRKVYGTDYAYHQLDGTYQKAFRMPVYGVKSDNKFYAFKITMLEENSDGTEVPVEKEYKISSTMKYDLKTIEKNLDILKDLSSGKTLSPEKEQALDAFLGAFGQKILDDGKTDRVRLNTRKVVDVSDVEESVSSNGYLAIVEEGESLCEIASYHGGRTSDYHTVQLSFNPRPKDSYDISDSISVSAASMRTVVSDRKYSGNLKVHYVMLTDEELAKETDFNKNPSFYRADYVGMADAYSDYLSRQGILKRLTSEEVEDDIPLYIESFGTLEVTEQFLSFPVDVMKPLTTFDDIIKMYSDLSDEKTLGDKSIKNINFRLTGFANGGMYSTVPSKLKWEKSVGGKKGFEKLLQFAQDVNESGEGSLGIYPDFDFLYRHNSSAFDGVKLKRDAIKTIDNRYTSKRYYSATQRKWTGFFELALSPAAIDRFYTKLLKNYTKYLDYGSLGISVSTLGMDLSTDFDEDEPYNREDNKRFIRQAFEEISSKEKLRGVMADGGNAYVLQYVDHLLNVELDSSRFMRSSYSIPFTGLVLHGCVQFAGAPMNMEGDVNYAILKAIENGASLYFILSYRNTSELKEDRTLSKYYSVNYSIWKDDVIENYNLLNDALHDVQDKTIIDHRFLVGTRILDISEIETAVRETMEANEEYETSYEEMVKMEKIETIAAARAAAKVAVQTLRTTRKTLSLQVSDMENAKSLILTKVDDASTAKNKYEVAKNDPKYKQDRIDIFYKTFNNRKNEVKNSAIEYIQMAVDAENSYKEMLQLLETAGSAKALLEADGAATELIEAAEQNVRDAQESLEAIAALVERFKACVDGVYEAASEYFTKEEIDVLVNFHEDEEEEEKEEDEDTSYASDKGNIVAVTYGERNGAEETPYKTFILNYNNYAVTITYDVDGVEKIYTIPAGEFVIIMH